MANPSSHEILMTLSPLGRCEAGEADALAKLPSLDFRHRLQSSLRRAAFAGWYYDVTRGMYPRRDDLDALPSAEDRITS